MPYQFPEPPIVPGFVKRFTAWGSKPEPLIGRTIKFKLKRENRIATSTVGGITFVHEPEDQALLRISREDGEARAALDRPPRQQNEQPVGGRPSDLNVKDLGE